MCLCLCVSMCVGIPMRQPNSIICSQFLMRSLKKTMTTQASSTVDNHESVDMDICDGTTNERKAFNFLNTKSSHAPINRVGHQTGSTSYYYYSLLNNVLNNENDILLNKYL